MAMIDNPFGPSLPNDRKIYRAIPYEKMITHGRIAARVFMLKPAHVVRDGQQVEDETWLSFGVDAAAAEQGLSSVFKICELSVGEIISHGAKLGFALEVCENRLEPNKVCVHGIPIKTTDEKGAQIIAHELASIAKVL
jgi:hypothetical protein